MRRLWSRCVLCLFSRIRLFILRVKDKGGGGRGRRGEEICDGSDQRTVEGEEIVLVC